MQSHVVLLYRAYGNMGTTGEEHWKTRRHDGFAMIVIICYQIM